MTAHADLHSHTRASDGVLSPADLLAEAAARGVRVLAVTDHDTLGAIAEATAAGERLGVRVVPGVEISCDHAHRDLHLLGLFVDPDDPALLARLAESRAERARVADRVLRRLADCRVPVTREAVESFATGETLGRPHFARALLAAGHVASVQEAFDKYLADGRPACVYRERPTIAEACALIHGAGGIASLAHPGIYRSLDRAAVSRMRQVGLDAVEVRHPSHDADARERYRRIAGGLGLAATGGSDFHGTGEGAAPGTDGLDEAGLAALEQRAARRRDRTATGG